MCCLEACVRRESNNRSRIWSTSTPSSWLLLGRRAAKRVNFNFGRLPADGIVLRLLLFLIRKLLDQLHIPLTRRALRLNAFRCFVSWLKFADFRQNDSRRSQAGRTRLRETIHRYMTSYVERIVFRERGTLSRSQDQFLHSRK
jgi:hypothetical protein